MQRYTTGWRRPIGYLILIGQFPQKSPMIHGSFAKIDLQLEASDGSLPSRTSPDTFINKYFVSCLPPPWRGYARHKIFTRVTRHYSFTRVTRHYSFVRVTWLNCRCVWNDMTYSYKCHMTCSHVWHDPFLSRALQFAHLRAKCDMQCVAVCCSVLQCVAVCCSVLQCVFVCIFACKVWHDPFLSRALQCGPLHTL